MLEGVEKVKAHLKKVQEETKKTQEETEGLSEGIGGKLKGAIGALGAVVATSGLIELGTQIINVNAEAKALESQYTQVMAGMKGASDKYISAMSQEWNKHPRELQGAMLQYMAILKSKGVAEEDAFNIAKTMLERTVDANAFANEDMSATTERFVASLKGEYDSLDTALVNLSATMLNDLAVKEYGKKFDELTVTQQEQLKVQEMIRQHTSAGVVGQGVREADEYANNLAMVKQNFKDLLIEYGSPLLDIANNALKKTNEILLEIPAIVDQVKAKWQEFLDKLNELQPILIGATAIIGVFATGITIYNGATILAKANTMLMTASVRIWTVTSTIATAITTAFGAAIAFLTSPIGIVVLAISGLIAVGVALYMNWDKVKAKAVQIWNFIKATFDKAKAGLTKAMNDMKTMFSNAWNSIKTSISNACSNIWNGIKSVWNNIKSTVTNVGNSIKTSISNVWNGIKTATSNAFNAVKTTITNTINGARDAVKRGIDKMKSFFNFKWSLPKIKLPRFSISGKFSLNPPQIPKFSLKWYKKGGYFDKPSIVGLGESGGEAIIPIENRKRLQPFAKAIAENLQGVFANGSGGNGEPLIIQVPLYLDSREIARAITPQIDREQERLRKQKQAFSF